MKHTLFLAGATGAIGQRLIPLLVAAGYEVHGSTRRKEKVPMLERLGARALVLDVYDAPAVVEAVSRVRPSVIVHQLTDLPANLDPAKLPEAIANNARVRRVGTGNLVAAAVAAGCPRIVAQSIAWAYAAGEKPYDEAHSLDLGAEGNRAITVGGVAALEAAVLGTAGLRGTVLRYGNLYGPGTGADSPSGAMPLHVDAAASAALLAVQRDVDGVFNVAEANDTVRTEKAQTLLGWASSFRLTETVPA